MEKSLIKTAKLTHNRCLYLQTYEKLIWQVYETFYKKQYDILETKRPQHKSIHVHLVFVSSLHTNKNKNKQTK